MPTVKIRASTILGEFGQAQFELVGKAVILTDGKAGTVENVCLDENTLDECIRGFMSQPKSQHHLYEIHTAPQSDLVSAVLSAEHIVELARLKDFL